MTLGLQNGDKTFEMSITYDWQPPQCCQCVPRKPACGCFGSPVKPSHYASDFSQSVPKTIGTWKVLEILRDYEDFEEGGEAEFFFKLRRPLELRSSLMV